MLLSKKPTLADGNFSNSVLRSVPHSFDDGVDPYARIPTVLAPCSCARNGVPWPAHLKQMAPIEPKIISLPFISGLMFQMNVGWLAAAKSLAPLNTGPA